MSNYKCLPVPFPSNESCSKDFSSKVLSLFLLLVSTLFLWYINAGGQNVFLKVGQWKKEQTDAIFLLQPRNLYRKLLLYCYFSLPCDCWWFCLWLRQIWSNMQVTWSTQQFAWLTGCGWRINVIFFLLHGSSLECASVKVSVDGKFTFFFLFHSSAK